MHAHIQARINAMQRGEVPEGYRETKVGIIPDDWDVCKIKHIAEVKRGAGSQYIRYVESSCNGVRLIRINDFFENKPVYVVPNDEIMRFSIGTDDILFAGTGASAGASYMPREEWIGLPHSYNAPRIRVDKETNKEYILYSLHSDYIVKQQKTLFVGAAQPFLDIKAISNFSIAFPPCSEQRQIAEILSAWDDAIRLQHDLIAQKKTQKRGLMQVLLTGAIRVTEMGRISADTLKQRVADIQQGIVPEGYKATKLGIIPGNWQVALLKQIAKRIVTVNDGKEHSVLTISATSGFLNQSERFSKVIAGKNIENYLLLQKNDFAYNKGNSRTYPQGCIYCLTDYDTALVPNVYYCFRISNDSVDYYRQYFSAGQLNHQLKGIINSGVRNDGLLNLHASDFFRILVLRPALKDQHKIAQILTTADKEIELLETELQHLRAQKTGLMQLLLTGAARVNDLLPKT